MPSQILTYVWAVWIAFYAIWILASTSVKRTERRESMATRISYTAVTLVAFVLFADPYLSTGFLGLRVIPASRTVQFAGFAIVLAGAAFAFWARFTIGRNWSSNVTIKKDHELIRRGPYAFVRHPIYTGILTMVLGTAIVIGEIRALGALGLAFLGFRIKSLIEERFMTEQFGEQYADYKARVRALIPLVY